MVAIIVMLIRESPLLCNCVTVTLFFFFVEDCAHAAERAPWQSATIQLYAGWGGSYDYEWLPPRKDHDLHEIFLSFPVSLI